MRNMKEFYEDYWRGREAIGHIYNTESQWIPSRFSTVASMISSKGGHLDCIDVGCGEGTMGYMLRERHGSDLYLSGCDISDKALGIASSYYDEIIQCNFDTDDLWERVNSQKYDYVICLETLQHLFRPETLLSSFASILENDGEIIVSFTNSTWYGYRLDLLKGRFPQYTLFNSGEHLQHYSLTAFKKLLDNAGFVPVEIGGQFRFPWFCRPARMFHPVLKKFPSLFGYRLVVRGRLKSKLQ